MNAFWTGNKKDEYYTPDHAVKLIAKYLKPNSTILCPFDKWESQFVQVLTEAGHLVWFSHIDEPNTDGKMNTQFRPYKKSCLIPNHKLRNNFFDYTKEKLKEMKIDYIISNPPFTKKNEVLEKLYELEVPFAILTPMNAMVETARRQNLYNAHGVELLIPDKRIKFIDGQTGEVAKSPAFTSGYVCYKVLPQQLIFDTLEI